MCKGTAAGGHPFLCVVSLCAQHHSYNTSCVCAKWPCVPHITVPMPRVPTGLVTCRTLHLQKIVCVACPASWPAAFQFGCLGAHTHAHNIHVCWPYAAAWRICALPPIFCCLIAPLRRARSVGMPAMLTFLSALSGLFVCWNTLGPVRSGCVLSIRPDWVCALMCDSWVIPSFSSLLR